MRLDADELTRIACGSISFQRGSEHERSVAAANFDNPFRAMVANERISDLCVDPLKESIVKVEMLVVVPGLGESPLVGIGKDIGVQVVDLVLKAEIDGRERTAGGPVFVVKGLEAGHGKIEVRWCDAYAQACLYSMKEGRESEPDARASHDAAHNKYLGWRLRRT